MAPLQAAQLRDVLELHAVHTAAGLSLSTAGQVALLLRRSEHRAGRLLLDAIGLAELPGAFGGRGLCCRRCAG